MQRFLFSILSVWTVHRCSAAYLGQRIDSNSPNYAELYEQLDEEYEQQLHTVTMDQDFQPVTSDPDWVKQYEDEVPLMESKEATLVVGKVKEPEKGNESHAVATSRLQCENPWFWNTFKCVWLDVRDKKTSKRTHRNAKTAGITIGIISILTVLPLCWFCLVAVYFRSKVKTYAKLMDRYMTEYMPGSIILPDGRVKYYDPTPEEEEAFEDLIHVITSVV